MKQSVSVQNAAQKYDLLTALGSWGLAQEKSVQRQVLRLICLITARYNWADNLLQLPQSEIARLWSVDVRTVKREMAAFRERGWVIERQRATRGRQTVLGLNIEQILRDTESQWDDAGAGLRARLTPKEAPQVIPFPRAVQGSGRWPDLAAKLATQDGALYQAWFAALTPVSEADELVLRAPSPFHANYVSTHFLPRLEKICGTPVRLIA